MIRILHSVSNMDRAGIETMLMRGSIFLQKMSSSNLRKQFSRKNSAQSIPRNWMPMRNPWNTFGKKMMESCHRWNLWKNGRKNWPKKSRRGKRHMLPCGKNPSVWKLHRIMCTASSEKPMRWNPTLHGNASGRPMSAKRQGRSRLDRNSENVNRNARSVATIWACNQQGLPPCTPEPCRMRKPVQDFPIRQGLLKTIRRKFE